MSERRRMKRDLYGIRGWFRGGEVVDHIPRGVEVEIGRNAAGRKCLKAYDREYPLDAWLEHDVRVRSEPLAD